MPEELKFSTKAMPGQLTVDEAEGIVEAFVAGIGNKDSVGDIVLPGAFSASLKRRKPRVVWGHNWNEPIGKVLEIYEVGPDDPRLPAKMKAARIGGLFARVQFNLKSERGREAFANIAFFGMEQEWSIGYKTITAAYDNARQANLLREVELYEVSPVLHGANQLTGTISVKSDNMEDRVSSFRKSKWEMFDRKFAEMIKEEHPKIWDAGGNIKGDDQYTILTKIAEQGGVAQTEDQIKALELREAWVARHEGDFLLPGVIAQIKWLAIGDRGEGHMKNVVKEAISKENGSAEKAAPACPIATRDIAVNIKNRQNAIDTAAYGPLNPELPNDKYWAARADRWDVTPDEARKQRCGNCAAFLKTPRILDCIKQGLGNETGNDAMSVIEAGDLGYCESFDFKCASARTCDGWVSGGPVTEEKKGYGYGAIEDDPKGHGYGEYEREGSSDDDPMEELGRIAARMRVVDEDEKPREEAQTNEAMGRRAVLARALANELRTPVRIRSISGNTVVFDVMDESEEPTTMRSSWHAENGRVMIGRPERVRVETVYVPEAGDSEGNAYMGDEEYKAPIPPDVIPQERITGDVLRGRGPRRGNLERLLRYWRPIMRKEGGFRRCLVILADHPELYPLQNICAWLHHETTGLWPNEGCHHPGMKNCRRKLRRGINGSLFSDSEFNNRLSRLDSKPDGKGTPDPFEMDYEKGDMGEVTEDDVQYAYKVMNWFAGEEKDFMKYLIDEKNWMHEGDDEDEESYEHEFVKPTNAPAVISGEKQGDCGGGCSGAGGKGSCMDDEKSLEDELLDLQEKVGRVLNSRNADKISQAIRLLSEVVGEEVAGVAMQRKDDTVVLEAPIEDLFELREMIDPIIEHYALEAEVDEKGIHINGLVTDGAEMALKTAIANFDEIQTKSIGRQIGRGSRGGPNAGRFIPNDGDGDGFFSIAPGAPDKTPVSKLPKRGAPDKPQPRYGGTVLDVDQALMDEVNYGKRPYGSDSFGRRNRSGRDAFGNPVRTAGDEKRQREAEQRMRERRADELKKYNRYKKNSEKERAEEEKKKERALRDMVNRLGKAREGEKSAQDQDAKAIGGGTGKPRDGDGDGKFSLTPKAPDETPLPPIPDLPDKDLLDLLAVKPQSAPTGRRIGFNPGPAKKLEDRKDEAYQELIKRGYSNDDLAKRTDRGTALRGSFSTTARDALDGGKPKMPSPSVVARRAAKPMETNTPKRFQYRPHQYNGQVFSDEYDVLVAGESIGTVVRTGEPDGYWGAWKAGRELFSTRREASVAVWKRASVKKPKPAKDSPEDFKKRFEEVNSLGPFKRHKPTMQIMDDIDDALDNEDLDEKTRLDLLSAQIDIINDFDLQDNGVEQAADFWSRIEWTMSQFDKLKVSDANSKKADELYKSMLKTYEGIQEVFKSEYERRDHDEIFGIEPYLDDEPTYSG